MHFIISIRRYILHRCYFYCSIFFHQALREIGDPKEVWGKSDRQELSGVLVSLVIEDLLDPQVRKIRFYYFLYPFNSLDALILHTPSQVIFVINYSVFSDFLFFFQISSHWICICHIKFFSIARFMYIAHVLSFLWIHGAVSSTQGSGGYSPLLPWGRHIIIVTNERAYNVTRYSILFVILFINILMYIVNIGIAY